MRLGEPSRMQAAINITPLVDVVLVLLIIFMVMAPQMGKGPEVQLPDTEKPSRSRTPGSTTRASPSTKPAAFGSTRKPSQSIISGTHSAPRWAASPNPRS